MDSHLQIPARLRLSRQNFSLAATIDDSGIHTDNHYYDRDTVNDDDNDDNESTPRLGMSKITLDSHDGPLNFSAFAQAQSTPAADTPAARLRALLSRDSGSATPKPRPSTTTSQRPTSPSVSMLESDMDMDPDVDDVGSAKAAPGTPYPKHQFSPSPPQSVARASLTNLFARALREPGDTPVKSQRRRRSSIDSSGVEESPVKMSALRAGMKAKRLSLSDDEKEKASMSGLANGTSEKSFRSSHAATYDTLRERLTRSNMGASTSTSASVDRSDMSIDAEGSSNPDGDHLHDAFLPNSANAIPAATSTPLRQSLSQFPSQFIGSDLMIDDSDMQRVFQDVKVDTTTEGSETDHADNKTPVAGPSSNKLRNKPSFVRERSLSRHSSMESLNFTHSRPSSSQSMNSQDSVQGERKYELERGWNRPLSAYMDRHHSNSPGLSPGHSRTFSHRRRDSGGSFSSSENGHGRASPALSVESESDRHEQHDNEHASHTNPDASQPQSRSPSNSPVQIRLSARTRTTSQPAKSISFNNLNSSGNSSATQRPNGRPRADSVAAHEDLRPSSGPVHPRSASALAFHNGNGNYDHDSASRSASPVSSRTSSRTSSRASSHTPDDPVKEVDHARERNWNAPHPKWNGVEPSLSSRLERRRSQVTSPVGTPPAERPRRETPSPSAGLTSGTGMNSMRHEHSTTTKNSTYSKEKENHSPQARRHKDPGSASRTSNSRSSLLQHTSSSSHRRAQSPSASSKTEPDLNLRRASNWAFPRSSTHLSPPEHDSYGETDETDEPVEHDTPKIGLQHLPGSPSSVPGPSSRTGISANFVTQIPVKANAHDRSHAKSASLSSEKSRLRGEGKDGPSKSKPPKTSIASEAIFFHDSDLESFHEEDIVASSSGPRVPLARVSTKRNPFFDEEASQSDLSESDVNKLNLRELASGPTEDTAARRSPSLPANFSPPPSPPIMPSDPITTTPKRKVPGNSSKLDFKTPSPPKGMPALPEPPTSSDEGVESDLTPPVRTPVTPANRNRYANTKTPRPPGGWSTPFATPAPATKTLPSEPDPEKKHVVKQGDVYTPPASYSRATSTTLKTPAPPGAWQATPGTNVAKRLQQKVRFDEQEPSIAPTPNSASENSSLLSNGTFLVDGSVALKAEKATPSPPRTPRRISGIRVLDAFGKEIAPKPEDNPEKRARSSVDSSPRGAEKEERADNSLGRKTRIRILDTLGKEVQEPNIPMKTALAMPSTTSVKHTEEEGVSTFFQELEGKNLERKQALELLQKTIADLKSDFYRTDDLRSLQNPDAVDLQIADLKAQSIRAREQRERLLSEIQELKANGLPSNATRFVNGVTTRLQTRLYSKAFWALVVMQIIIIIALYRLSFLGARRLFLTTYIDPFYPELNLHITSPDLLRLSMSPMHSSHYASETKRWWMHFLVMFWQHLVDRIYSLREGVWDVWRDPPAGSIAWPPT
ncbi:hypothetical protein DFH11DRAFT_1562529 [Phellopilus nigrolimitatus]|nr:hypothetical protein DFH11DRAFT_1562529 [Phellopilus nigrolimitatus]